MTTNQLPDGNDNEPKLYEVKVPLRSEIQVITIAPNISIAELLVQMDKPADAKVEITEHGELTIDGVNTPESIDPAAVKSIVEASGQFVIVENVADTTGDNALTLVEDHVDHSLTVEDAANGGAIATTGSAGGDVIVPGGDAGGEIANIPAEPDVVPEETDVPPEFNEWVGGSFPIVQIFHRTPVEYRELGNRTPKQLADTMPGVHSDAQIFICEDEGDRNGLVGYKDPDKPFIEMTNVETAIYRGDMWVPPSDAVNLGEEQEEDGPEDPVVPETSDDPETVNVPDGYQEWTKERRKIVEVNLRNELENTELGNRTPAMIRAALLPENPDAVLYVHGETGDIGYTDEGRFQALVKDGNGYFDAGIWEAPKPEAPAKVEAPSGYTEWETGAHEIFEVNNADAANNSPRGTLDPADYAATFFAGETGVQIFVRDDGLIGRISDGSFKPHRTADTAFYSSDKWTPPAAPVEAPVGYVPWTADSHPIYEVNTADPLQHTLRGDFDPTTYETAFFAGETNVQLFINVDGLIGRISDGQFRPHVTADTRFYNGDDWTPPEAPLEAPAGYVAWTADSHPIYEVNNVDPSQHTLRGDFDPAAYEAAFFTGEANVEIFINGDGRIGRISDGQFRPHVTADTRFYSGDTWDPPDPVEPDPVEIPDGNSEWDAGVISIISSPTAAPETYAELGEFSPQDCIDSFLGGRPNITLCWEDESGRIGYIEGGVFHLLGDAATGFYNADLALEEDEEEDDPEDEDGEEDEDEDEDGDGEEEATGPELPAGQIAWETGNHQLVQPLPGNPPAYDPATLVTTGPDAFGPLPAGAVVCVNRNNGAIGYVSADGELTVPPSPFVRLAEWGPATPLDAAGIARRNERALHPDDRDDVTEGWDGALNRTGELVMGDRQATRGHWTTWLHPVKLFREGTNLWRRMTRGGKSNASAQWGTTLGTGYIAGSATNIGPESMMQLYSSGIATKAGWFGMIPLVGPLLIQAKRIAQAQLNRPIADHELAAALDEIYGDDTNGRRQFERDLNIDSGKHGDHLVDTTEEVRLVRGFHKSQLIDVATCPALGTLLGGDEHFAKHVMLPMTCMAHICAEERRPLAEGETRLQVIERAIDTAWEVIRRSLPASQRNNPQVRADTIQQLNDALTNINGDGRYREALANHDVLGNISAFDEHGRPIRDNRGRIITPEEERQNRIKQLRECAVAYGRTINCYQRERGEGIITGMNVGSTGAITAKTVWAAFAAGQFGYALTLAPAIVPGLGYLAGRQGHRLWRNSRNNIRIDPDNPRGELVGKNNGPIISDRVRRLSSGMVQSMSTQLMQSRKAIADGNTGDDLHPDNLSPEAAYWYNVASANWNELPQRTEKGHYGNLQKFASHCVGSLHESLMDADVYSPTAEQNIEPLKQAREEEGSLVKQITERRDALRNGQNKHAADQRSVRKTTLQQAEKRVSDIDRRISQATTAVGRMTTGTPEFITANADLQQLRQEREELAAALVELQSDGWTPEADPAFAEAGDELLINLNEQLAAKREEIEGLRDTNPPEVEGDRAAFLAQNQELRKGLAARIAEAWEGVDGKGVKDNMSNLERGRRWTVAGGKMAGKAGLYVATSKPAKVTGITAAPVATVWAAGATGVIGAGTAAALWPFAVAATGVIGTIAAISHVRRKK